jgi:hypothetical protein
MSKTNKKLFIEVLNALDEQSKHDDMCSDAFRKILPEASGVYYITDSIVEALHKTLDHLSEYKDSGDWVFYFIYDLDFGRKYKKGMVNQPNGDEIRINTASRLYDFLMTL